MCAFMMPVMKKDWEVYATKRSRNNSETSQRCDNFNEKQRSKSGQLRKQRGLGTAGRSMSYNAPPRNHSDLMYVGSPPKAYHLSTRNSRNTSRNSISNGASGLTSPTKTDSQMTEKDKNANSPPFNKFHTKLLDKLKNALTIKSSSSTTSSERDQPPPEDTSSVNSITHSPSSDAVAKT